MDKIKCIYAIKDKRNDKTIYIGETVNFQGRKQHHLNDKERPIDYYMFEQGRDNFEINVLEELNEDLSKEEMKNKEQHYIDKFDTYNNGFNKRKSGNISKTKDYNKNRTKKSRELNPEHYKQYNANYYSTQEYREKAKERSKIRNKTPERKAWLRQYRLKKKLESQDK